MLKTISKTRLSVIVLGLFVLVGVSSAQTHTIPTTDGSYQYTGTNTYTQTQTFSVPPIISQNASSGQQAVNYQAMTNYVTGAVTNVCASACTFTGMVSLTGGATGTLTGHSTLDLPLTGGTVTGPTTFSSGITGTLTGHSTLDLPLTGGNLSGTFGQIVFNPAQVTQFSAPTFSPSWQFQDFNGQHTWTQSSGWYADSYLLHGYTFEDDQPGVDLAQPSYGASGHSEFYPYYYNVISRSPAFLEYGTSWQQNSISDSGQYDTGWCQGGWINSDDEGCFHLNYNGGELGYDYTGTVTSVGTNSVKTTCTGGCPTYNSATGTYSGGDQGDLRYLINTSSPMASGHIESLTHPSGQIPGTVTIDTTVPVSTAWGTLQANCGPANVVSPVGVTTTASACSVNLNAITAFGNSPGSFTTSSIVCFSGQFHECAYPTSVGVASGGIQTVNFNLLYPHNSGSVMMQGGAADTYIDLLANRGTDATSGTGTLKYPIDVIGSTSANTLVDVEFFIANDGATHSIGDGNLTGNLSIGSANTLSSISNTGGVVTFSVNSYNTTLNGQNIYIYNASDSTFDGACTNVKLNITNNQNTCSQASSTGHTATSANAALNCTSTNASCTANQYGNGDFVLYEGAQVLDVQDPSSSPANAIDGYFLLEPNPWTWTSATVEEPHHYATEIAERKGTLFVANPLSDTSGVSVKLQGTGVGTPYDDSTYGAVNGHYNSSSLFVGQNANSPGFYSYFGGTMVAPNGLSFQGLLYDTVATEYAPGFGGSVLWVGCPEQQSSIGGCADASYQYNLFTLFGNTGNASATYQPATNTLTWFGTQKYYLNSDYTIFRMHQGGSDLGLIPGGYGGKNGVNLAFPLELDSTEGTSGDVVEYTNCGGANTDQCGIKDAGIAATSVCLSNGTNCPASSGGSTENDVTFSATPAFSSTDGVLNTITLTANVTSSTMSGTPVAGARVGFLVCQNATGNFTFAWPSSFHGAATVGTTASKCSEQEFRYFSAQSAWFSVGVLNQ